MTATFKFLDAYSKADKAIFFGRAREVDQLYAMVLKTGITLVYGPSGTGKTSLIQCGLANRFRGSDWLPVFVRRRRDINQSLREEIAACALTAIPQSEGLQAAIKSLYLDYLRPVYLIFDQFEELFVLGSAEEQAAFIADIAALLRSGVACKVIIGLREDYLAMLSGFEEALPSLFDNRLRVEPMNLVNLEKVIAGTLDQMHIGLEGGQDTARKIIGNLSDPRNGVQLSYLQVYLDRLYRRAAAAAPAGSDIVFTNALVDQLGKLGDVLADFLDEQTAAIEIEISARHAGLPADAVQQVLEAGTTLEGTKAPVTRPELVERLPALAGAMDDILAALVASRILRQTAGDYELAHNALAARIGDRRSLTRKTLLRLEKIVRDRLAAFDQTRTFLNRQELALLFPYEKELSLDAVEAAFVRRSQREALRERRLRYGGYGVVVLIVMATLAVSAAWVTDPDRVSQWAADLSADGRYASAEALLNVALWAHPDDRGLLFDRADVYVSWGKKDLAIRDFAKIRNDYAGSSEVSNKLCWFQATRNFELPTALKDCNEALKHSDVLDSRAFVLFRLGSLQEALKDYDEALKLRPPRGKERAMTLYGRGRTQLALGHRKLGLEDEDKARALDPMVDDIFGDYLRPPPAAQP